jgi:hypothetical protein
MFHSALTNDQSATKLFHFKCVLSYHNFASYDKILYGKRPRRSCACFLSLCTFKDVVDNFNSLWFIQLFFRIFSKLLSAFAMILLYFPWLLCRLYLTAHKNISKRSLGCDSGHLKGKFYLSICLIKREWVRRKWRKKAKERTQNFAEYLCTKYYLSFPAFFFCCY